MQSNQIDRFFRAGGLSLFVSQSKDFCQSFLTMLTEVGVVRRKIALEMSRAWNQE